MQTQHSLGGAEISDEALLAAVREGDIDQFGQLYKRYYGMARAIAFKHTSDASRVDDVVSESFARILQALKNGKGPHSYMGGYLSTTIAHLAGEYGMLSAKELPSEQEHLEAMGSLDDTVLKLHESHEVVTAFTSLPERWQTVLWMTEIELKKPREVATAMALSPNAVSALAVRAKESLREGFLRAHQNSPATAECHRFHSFISPYVRGSLSQKRSDALRSHMEECKHCTAEYLSLVGINKSMRSWVFPVLAGLGLWTTDGATLLTAAGVSASSGASAAATGSAAGQNGSAGTAAGGSSAATASSSNFSLLAPSTWGMGAQVIAGAAATAVAVVAVVGGSILADNNQEPDHVQADPQGYAQAEEQQTSRLGEEFSPYTETPTWNAQNPSSAAPTAVGSTTAGRVPAPVAAPSSARIGRDAGGSSALANSGLGAFSAPGSVDGSAGSSESTGLSSDAGSRLLADGAPGAGNSMAPRAPLSFGASSLPTAGPSLGGSVSDGAAGASSPSASELPLEPQQNTATPTPAEGTSPEAETAPPATGPYAADPTPTAEAPDAPATEPTATDGEEEDRAAEPSAPGTDPAAETGEPGPAENGNPTQPADQPSEPAADTETPAPGSGDSAEGVEPGSPAEEPGSPDEEPGVEPGTQPGETPGEAEPAPSDDAIPEPKPTYSAPKIEAPEGSNEEDFWRWFSSVNWADFGKTSAFAPNNSMYTILYVNDEGENKWVNMYLPRSFVGSPYTKDVLTQMYGWQQVVDLHRAFF